PGPRADGQQGRTWEEPRSRTPQRLLVDNSGGNSGKEPLKNVPSGRHLRGLLNERCQPALPSSDGNSQRRLEGKARGNLGALGSVKGAEHVFARQTVDVLCLDH